MRYAIIADIHANLEACEAVLEAIDRENVDAFICLGDIVGYGADPSRVIEITARLNPVMVAGNHDLAAAGAREISGSTPSARAAIEWTRDRLTEREKRFLKELPLVWRESFVAAHGSPHHPERFDYVSGLSAARSAFSSFGAGACCFIGHTHAARIFVRDEAGGITCDPLPELKISKKCSYIINPGSVGQPRDSDPRAAYAIFDEERSLVQLKRVTYDIDKACRKIIDAGLPQILGERLRLGK
ncbi:MAG: metallophosphoesterase family protein [Candidatus Omnitrophota bacterium]